MTDPMVEKPLRLIDLNARFLEHPDRIVFNCPRCRVGIIRVDLREGDALGGIHGCNGLPPNFETLTITPSIADEAKCTARNRGCPGWHGFIINGEVR